MHSIASGCDNRGLNVAADVAGPQHLAATNVHANGHLYLMGDFGAALIGAGCIWDRIYMGIQGYACTKGSDPRLFVEHGYTWDAALRLGRAMPGPNPRNGKERL